MQTCVINIMKGDDQRNKWICVGISIGYVYPFDIGNIIQIRYQWNPTEVYVLRTIFFMIRKSKLTQRNLCIEIVLVENFQSVVYRTKVY